MTEARDQLLKLTECCICFQAFTDPRTLPCIHTFCLQCLKQTGDATKKKPGEKMPCPVCRKAFSIPVEGMTSIQKNFFMENLIDVTGMLKLGQKQVIVCDMCKALHEGDEENTKEAMMRCLECRDNFCDMCAKTHRLSKLSKTHNIVKIGSETEENFRSMQPIRNCTDHNEKPLDFYCSVCKKILCVSCFVENHALHKCKDVNTVHSEFRQTIEMNAAKISNCVEEIQSKAKMVEQRKTEVLLNLAKTEDTIMQRNLQLKEMIDRDTSSLLEELSVIKQKQIKNFAIQKEEIDRVSGILKSFETYCTELTARGSASDVCSCVDELITRTNELKKDHVAFISRPFEMTEVSFKDTDLPGLLSNPSNNIVGQIECKLIGYALSLQQQSASSDHEQGKLGQCVRQSRDELEDQRIIDVGISPCRARLAASVTDMIGVRGMIPKGFQNYGNTCYFNSVLQCLLQTVLLPFELTVNLYGLENVLTQKKEMSCLSKAFVELVSKYNVSEQREASLKTLYYTIKEAYQRFDDQRQHDSHDLLSHFLDKLRVEERNAWKTPSAGPQTQKTLTAIDRIFGGQFITIYICHSCKDPYTYREPFLDISIPLCILMTDEQKPTTRSEFQIIDAPKSISTKEVIKNMLEINQSSSSAIDENRKATSTREVIKCMLRPLAFEPSAEPEVKALWPGVFKTNPNVSQCLKYFTRAELIKDEYLCRNCQTPESDELTMTSATKHTLISSPPAILVLHLKRFEQKPTGFVKRDEMISYNELLDLGPFCSCSALRVDPEEVNVWYSLYAVVVHCGFSISKGHYVAYVKQRDSSAQMEDELREKFLQKNFDGCDKFPNDDDLATMEKRKAVKRREKAKRPHPIPGQWFRIKDDSVRPCDTKEALEQKAFLLFYERITGNGYQNTGV